MGAADSSATYAPSAAATGNGGHDLSSSQGEAHEVVGEGRPEKPETPEPAPREYHAEPREPGPAHESAPIAHFEPSAKPEPSGTQTKPYVVWSSAPTQKDGGNRGPEE